MNRKEDYCIPFTGLSNGKHNFEFDISNTFFEQLDYSEVQAGTLKVDVLLEKQTTMLVVTLTIKGFVSLVCDRCGENFNTPLDASQQLIYKLNNAEFVDEDEIVYLSSSDSEVKLKHKIYEFIMLSVPAKRVHPDDEKGKSTCNKEALKLLKKYAVKEKENKQQTDPRWDVLKNIINN
ncbi:MAG: DUF177 domain-containing protein [Bacteroidetes bacterium]|nr:DUF177 domain-containing protein [Bacteroidota bacterium]